MTDPDLADATYVEPLTSNDGESHRRRTAGRHFAHSRRANGPESCRAVGRVGRVGTVWGATHWCGTCAIRIAEDRSKFQAGDAEAAGVPVPVSYLCIVWKRRKRPFRTKSAYPVLIRASFTLGGTGGGMAPRPTTSSRPSSRPARQPRQRNPLERSLIGWKEYELEVMRDKANNFVVVCSIENVDPMGVHTGDSITVAPAQTLTDRNTNICATWPKR
jgi:carbamoyl-phosphate synthase large subunit